MLESVTSYLTFTNILLLVTSYLAYKCYRSVCRPAGFPPGPRPLPILGNLLSLNGQLYEVYNDFAKQYGDIIGLKFGPYWMVILNSIETARDAYLKKPVQFAGRPQTFSIKLFTMGYKDIAFSPCTDTWKLHRKISHSAIREFASGKRLEDLVFNVLPKLAHTIDANEGKSFEPKEGLAICVYNILATMCFGHEYEFDDPKLRWWMDFQRRLQKEFGSGLLPDFISFLKYFPPDAKTKKCIALMNEWFDNLRHEMKAHREKYNPEDVGDLIDCLIRAQQEAIDEGSEEVDSLTDDHLLQTLGDIFSAGADTTIYSLHWAIALMTKHPEIQEKVAEEIDRVVGRERPPSLEDRGKLPYTEAALCELLRYSSIAPLGLTHATTEDTTLGGYRIPKGTWVVVNHWAIHYDEKHWENPRQFRPEHFLDESGEVRQHANGYLPFSFGRRVCLGESFAKAELFLLFSWLFQQYTFSKPPEQEGEFEIKLKKASMAHQADEYKIVAKKRF